MMACRTLIVLVACLLVPTLACIGQQTEDAVKQNGFVFDVYYYMNANGFPNPETSLYHWYWNGYYAGLQGSSVFNVNEYKQIYPELASLDNPAAIRHFVECGYYEGRVGLWSMYCGNNNGGCHPSTTCTNSYGFKTCGPCPPGTTGDGSGSCPPEVAPTNPPVTSGVLLSQYVYNYEFYITANTDLAGFSPDAASQHWVNWGVDEGRQAVSSFSVNDYKRIYPDAGALSNRDAVAQYVNSYTFDRIGLWAWYCANGNNGGCDAHVSCSNMFGGRAPWCGMCPFPEWSGNGDVAGGCYPSFIYDYRIWSYTYYLTANPELGALTEEQAKSHWRTNGMNEGRRALEAFSVQDYKRIYSDIAPMTNYDAIQHYVTAGIAENRVGNWDWWCGNANGGCDALVTCSNSWATMKPWCGMCPSGYTGTGSTPGSCRPTFPTDYRVFSFGYYITKYPELAPLSYSAVEAHWYNTGIPEGRQATATFSVNEYKQIYPDVAGLSNFDAVGHYVRIGFAEKRAGSFANWCGDGNNGGCDPLTTCEMDFWGGKRCGWCPPGYLGNGATGCTRN